MDSGENVRRIANSHYPAKYSSQNIIKNHTKIETKAGNKLRIYIQIINKWHTYTEK